MKKSKNNGITLVALVVTIIILLILAGISIQALTSTRLFKNTNMAKTETIKNKAKEAINLKITTIQIDSYAENKQLPSLQYLADKLCEDNDIEYVLKESKKVSNLEKIDVSTVSSIYTKLKEYPYEFEINSSLQLAKIDGIKVVDNNNNFSSLEITPELKEWIGTLGNLTLSLEDITDNNLLKKLMNNKLSVEYMYNNTTIFNAVLSSKYSMEALGQSAYASYIGITNDMYKEKILNSRYSNLIGKTIERQENNNNIIYSRIESTYRQPYYAFDNDISTAWSPSGYGKTLSTDFIGYDFKDKKIVYKCIMDGKYYEGNTYYYQIGSFMLQGSNDNNSWVDIQECKMKEESPNIFYINNTIGYRYYRCRFKSGSCFYVSSLQFYYLDSIE